MVAWAVAIRSFGSRATKRFARGDLRRLPPAIRNAASDALTLLQRAGSPRKMAVPGGRLHALKGSRKGFYAVKLSRRWRLVFRFVDGDAYDVEIVDYH